MKEHSFKVIHWCGGQTSPRYAVVEVDAQGPILRGGPYARPSYAAKRAETLAKKAPPQEERRNTP